ncbi:MAG: hypothetical protein Q7J29_00245 [Stagnimonas sp.]|nr:hypothetical protein [Stagnimonas sp.]
MVAALTKVNLDRLPLETVTHDSGASSVPTDKYFYIHTIYRGETILNKKISKVKTGQPSLPDFNKCNIKRKINNIIRIIFSVFILLTSDLIYADGFDALLNGLKNSIVEKAKEKGVIPPQNQTSPKSSARGYITAADWRSDKKCDSYNHYLTGGGQVEFITGRSFPAACALPPQTSGSIVLGDSGYADVEGPVWGLYFLLRNISTPKKLGYAESEDIAISAALNDTYFDTDPFSKKDLEASGREKVKNMLSFFKKDKVYIFPVWITFYEYNFEKKGYPVLVKTSHFADDEGYPRYQRNELGTSALTSQVPIRVTFDGRSMKMGYVPEPNYFIEVKDVVKARAIQQAVSNLGPRRILAAVKTKPVKAITIPNSIRSDGDPIFEIDFSVQQIDFYDRSGQPINLLE